MTWTAIPEAGIGPARRPPTPTGLMSELIPFQPWGCASFALAAGAALVVLLPWLRKPPAREEPADRNAAWH